MSKGKDRGIERAYEAGEKNKRTAELIHNWCAHARIEKLGGVGLIEAQTGLPIGHHTMACDHASAAGMATWDLADAALDFHDRNCAVCTVRAPVRLPNLTTLLLERDERRRRANDAQQAELAAEASAKNARRQTRQVVRKALSEESGHVIDLLEELDDLRNEETATKINQLASLAPELFAAPLVEHLFALSESGEGWADRVVLTCLQKLKSNPARLTSCALRALQRYAAIHIALEIVEANVALVDSALIEAALPALAAVANPRHFGFGGRRVAEPGALLALHRAHKDVVEKGLRELLDSRKPWHVSVAARGIEAVAAGDAYAADRFAKDVALKLARMEWLVDTDDDDLDQELPGDLQRALDLAFSVNPTGTDSLIENLLISASPDAQARLLGIYRRVLHGGWRETVTPTEAHAVALRRIVVVATNAKDYEVLQELQQILGSDPTPGLEVVARSELNGLLGAALLLDEQLDDRPSPLKLRSDPLKDLDRMNQRSATASLQGGLLQWALAGAKDHLETTTAYLKVLHELPANRETLRASMIEELGRLATSPMGLSAILPTLYTAIVGTSTLDRSAAARVIGTMRKQRLEDAPTLLLEAFVTLLADPYVIVHRAAVRALGETHLPPPFSAIAAERLRTLILVYATGKTNDAFLVEAMSLYAQRFVGRNKVDSNLARFIVKQMLRMHPRVTVREAAHLRHDLRAQDEFVLLVLKFLDDYGAANYNDDRVVECLRALQPKAIQDHRATIAAAAMKVLGRTELRLVLIETLMRGGAWEEAASVAEAAYEAMPDTARTRPMRLHLNLFRVATRFEACIAAGLKERTRDLAVEWHQSVSSIEQDKNEHAELRDPLRELRGKA